MVLGTVEGDLHEIGKTLVGIMQTTNGFNVVDIGIDKPASEFVNAIKENDATIGGAPVTESYAKPIGAGGHAENAVSAVDLAFRLADAPE